MIVFLLRDNNHIQALVKLREIKPYNLSQFPLALFSLMLSLPTPPITQPSSSFISVSLSLTLSIFHYFNLHLSLFFRTPPSHKRIIAQDPPPTESPSPKTHRRTDPPPTKPPSPKTHRPTADGASFAQDPQTHGRTPYLKSSTKPPLPNCSRHASQVRRGRRWVFGNCGLRICDLRFVELRIC